MTRFPAIALRRRGKHGRARACCEDCADGGAWFMGLPFGAESKCEALPLASPANDIPQIVDALAKVTKGLTPGVARYPRKVTRRRSARKLAVRNKVKPFIKPDFGSGRQWF
ncbi:hypothetical protein PLICRDRAFT_180867 [Plicaturopsis crispa FD-325 SS-3]|uniref:Uncharacterized protein n=1 Tax=Plicaturopsis crispa FD-325 SS-3 TaxID=944288 RepID=A0A0C9SK16_PLICR|nr:hypothetical protein PLICRDRAFT_180867 [Plicaturopsis crispa FD-325 SS-3]